jgi:hypothetical protein
MKKNEIKAQIITFSADSSFTTHVATLSTVSNPFIYVMKATAPFGATVINPTTLETRIMWPKKIWRQSAEFEFAIVDIGDCTKFTPQDISRAIKEAYKKQKLFRKQFIKKISKIKKSKNKEPKA